MFDVVLTVFKGSGDRQINGLQRTTVHIFPVVASIDCFLPESGQQLRFMRSLEISKSPKNTSSFYICGIKPIKYSVNNTMKSKSMENV